jgi:acetyl esterase/lipase
MSASETHLYLERPGSTLEIELVRPVGSADPGPAPAVIFFHGGEWRMGSREQFLPQCRRLADGGTIGITASYRLVSADNDLSPVDCANDAAEAVGWVRAHAGELGIEPNRIAAGGGSAGGQLAAAVAAMGVELSALVLFNPALGPDGTPRLHFMGDVGPAWDVTPGFPPALVLHGDADTIVPIEHSQRFAERMEAVGSRCELVEYEGMPHAFFNHPAPEGRYEETVQEMERFLMSLDLLSRAG